MFRPPVSLVVLALALGLPSVASANTSVFVLDGYVNVIGTSTAMDVEIDTPAAGTVRVVNQAPGDDLAASTGCTEAPPETVTCTGFDAAKGVLAYGSTQGDSIVVLPSATIKTQLLGRGGGDVLLGGSGNDSLYGGFGDDDIDGRDGSDLVENGRADNNNPVNDDDADIYRDTGSTGEDSLNYGPQNVGVHMKLDGLANDGNPATSEGDNILGGFEKLRGTIYGDTIVGGPAAEIINGSQGDDDLTGGGGADTIEGNEGVDTVRARDSEVDLLIDCDSASSVTQGVGETAFIDANDPEPQRCETVDRLGGAGPGPTPDPTPTTPAATTPTTGGTPDPGTPPANTTLAPLKLGAVNVTETVSRMPRVTGKKFATARDEVLKVIAFAQVEIEFKRGCKKGDFLEITKQTPITGTSLPNDVRSPAQVTLVACIAEADYLRDCDLAGVKADVKLLGSKALDADVALTVLGTVNKCKVDYDVKLAKAAEETRIKLEAQRASEALNKAARDKANAKKQADDKIKADLRANITCPTGGPLNVAIGDGYTPSTKALGFKLGTSETDPDAWTLPSHPAADLQSFISLTVTDKAAQFLEARVFLDADDVTDADTVGTKDVKITKKGIAVFSVRPQKSGWIRVCVVVETGADEVVSQGVEIRVGGQPKVGTVWETQNRRRIKITKDGPVAEKAAVRAAVPASIGLSAVGPDAIRGKKANFFADAWNAFVGFFSRRSETVNKQAATPGEGRTKLAASATGAKLGVAQIPDGPRLASNPEPPILNLKGKCISSTPDGVVGTLVCPTLIPPPRGATVIGTSADSDAPGTLAMGNGNVVKSVPQNTVPEGKGKLIGLDGSTLIGNDGSTLIGLDGSTLIGNDGSTLVGPDGGTLIGLDGSTLVGLDGSTLIGLDGSTLIGNDGSTLIGNDGSTLLGALDKNALMSAPAQVVARDGAGLMSATAGLVQPNGLK